LRLESASISSPGTVLVLSMSSQRRTAVLHSKLYRCKPVFCQLDGGAQYCRLKSALEIVHPKRHSRVAPFALTLQKSRLKRTKGARRMRLSEAILLGSTVVTPKAGALSFSGENAGCALGMAVIASGGTFHPAKHQFPVNERRTLNVEDIWGTWLLRLVARPCDCRLPLTVNRLRLKDMTSYLRHPRSAALPREMRIKDIVAHLFDYHVMGKRDWTLDRLTTWLQPLEPSEPAAVSSIRRRTAPERNLSAEAAEWRKTRESFEAQVKAKSRRFARRTE